MLNFILPRTNINLYDDMKCSSVHEKNRDRDGRFPIIGTRNIYIDNINAQINKFKTEWNIMTQIYYPYEFLGDVMKHSDESVSFFSLRYAMHIELQHFIKHELLNTNVTFQTLVFYGNDEYKLNGMNYLQGKNKDNKHISVKYDATDIKIILSKNLSNIDHIIIGSHSTDDNLVNYPRNSLICVLYMLCLQKFEGSSIVKLYNIDTPLSIGIIGILSSMYHEVHLVKPITSKSESSEIFVVCKKFLPKNSNSFFMKFMGIIHNLPEIDYGYDIFKREAINLQLINKINEISIIFYQRQLEYIHLILNTSIIQCRTTDTKKNIRPMINENNTKVLSIIKNNVNKCLDWTSKFHKPIPISSTPEINTQILRHLYDNVIQS